MLGFKSKVFKFVKSIPKGKVASYGQVAAALGVPRAARQVGWALHSLDGTEKLPWWRVVNNKGILSIRGNFMSTKEAQKKLLEKEGIKVSRDFTLDIEKYRYKYGK